eukprot:4536237-Ditylum_brightwellii.AAC.1
MTASVDKPGYRLKKSLMDAGILPSEIHILPDVNRRCKGEEMDVIKSNSVAEVKTLVWKVSCCNRVDPAQVVDVVEQHQKNVDEFYIVTAQSMSDKADLSLLHDLVFQQHNDLTFGNTTPAKRCLSLAPTDLAQELTGFQSGCIPPIGHTVPLKLYLEESISKCEIASIGSGTLGYSLLIPMKRLIALAENTEGIEIGSFSRSVITRSTSPSSVLIETTNEQVVEPMKKAKKTRRSEPKDRL